MSQYGEREAIVRKEQEILDITFKELLSILKAAGVSKFKDSAVAIEFFPPVPDPIAAPEAPLEKEDMLFYSSPIQDIKK